MKRTRVFLLLALAFVLSLSICIKDTKAEPRYPTMEIFERSAYRHITTATTTVVKSTSGILFGFVVNGGTMGQITIYDNSSASGTVVATITDPVAGQVWPCGCELKNGITIVTAAATDITVVYR